MAATGEDVGFDCLSLTDRFCIEAVLNFVVMNHMVFFGKSIGEMPVS